MFVHEMNRFDVSPKHEKKIKEIATSEQQKTDSRVHYFIFHIMHLHGGEWLRDFVCALNGNLQLKCIHSFMCSRIVNHSNRVGE